MMVKGRPREDGLVGNGFSGLQLCIESNGLLVWVELLLTVIIYLVIWGCTPLELLCYFLIFSLNYAIAELL